MQIRILNKSGTNHEVSVTLLKNSPRGTPRRKNVQSRTKIFNNVLSAVKTNSWLPSDETETQLERSTFTRSLRARVRACGVSIVDRLSLAVHYFIGHLSL